MSYEPTNWKTGDVVTSAKLNKLEQGVSGGGVLKVTANLETLAIDKTWQEIYDAGFAVMLFPPDIKAPDDHYVYFTSRISIAGSTFTVQFYHPEAAEPMVFTSDSADGVLVLAS